MADDDKIQEAVPAAPEVSEEEIYMFKLRAHPEGRERELVLYPDKKLREVSMAVEDFGPGFQQVVEDLIVTMYKSRGMGLSAIQLGVPLRVFILDCTMDKKPMPLKVYVNPEIISTKDRVKAREGCLSFPGISETVPRHHSVMFKAQDRYGNPFTDTLHLLEADAFQHELDHLNGVLMIDYLSKLAKRLLDNRVQKLAKQARFAKEREEQRVLTGKRILTQVAQSAPNISSKPSND